MDGEQRERERERERKPKTTLKTFSILARPNLFALSFRNGFAAADT